MRDLEAPLRALIEPVMRRQPIPNLAVAIIEKGALVHAFGLGVTDLASGAPCTCDTRFPIASITKTMTAAATMSLVERGLLSLQARLVDLLPHFAMRDVRHRDITVEHLLTHTSGMPDYHPLDGWNDEADDDGPIRGYVRHVAELELIDSPGQRHAYSNLAIDVLGDVLETVSGRSYFDLVQRDLIDPLGMTATKVEDPRPHVRATGHVTDVAGAVMPIAGLHHPAHAPSGWTAASTVVDLARWAIAHMQGGAGVIAKASVDALWTPRIATNRADRAQQALGWVEYRHRDERVVAHGGWDLGYRCGMSLLRDRDAGVIVMNGFHWSATKGLCDAVLDLLLDVEPSPILMPIERARSLAGRYGEVADVVVEGDDLFVTLAGKRSRLIPMDATAHFAPFGATLPGGPGAALLRTEENAEKTHIEIDGVVHRR